MKLIGYARVSTEEQAEKGISLDAQAARLGAYASAHRHELVGVEVDEGASAKSLQRPALARALRSLREGWAEGLLVAKLDRLTRSVVDLHSLIKEYFGEGAGYQLLSVADSIDTSKAAGRMVMTMMTVVAQWERETIIERTREAVGHKRRLGDRLGNVPYGFRLEDDGRRSRSGRPCHLAIDPDEMRVVARIAELRSEFRSYREIAAALDAEGVSTRGGSPWRHTTVRSIFVRVA